MRGQEEGLQRAVVQLMAFKLPADVFWFHCPNGEHRSKRTGARLKAMGVRAGVPDICLVRGGKFYGIELKAAGYLKGNRMEGRGYLSKVQRDCHADMRRAGATLATCWDLDGVQTCLNEWGLMKPLEAVA